MNRSSTVYLLLMQLLETGQWLSALVEAGESWVGISALPFVPYPTFPDLSFITGKRGIVQVEFRIVPGI